MTGWQTFWLWYEQHPDLTYGAAFRQWLDEEFGFEASRAGVVSRRNSGLEVAK